jgi:subtilisin family serine protease
MASTRGEGGGSGRKRRAPASKKRAATAPKQMRIDDDSAEQGGFIPRSLDRSVIAIPLLRELVEESNGKRAPKPHAVVIDLNFDYPGGRDEARKRVRALIARLPADATVRVDEPKTALSRQYLFATMSGSAIQQLVALDNPSATPVEDARSRTRSRRPDGVGARSIYRIWPDFEIRALLIKSVSTVKADAARTAFSAAGDGVVWAVIDSGIDARHPHFKAHANLELGDAISHHDFSGDGGTAESALTDACGHGTHVAGIIAGEFPDPRRASGKRKGAVRAITRHWDESGETSSAVERFDCITGVAPRAKLVSMKVLDAEGNGRTSNIIAALEQIQRVNDNGRRLLIHGVNLSVGYDFKPEWFACGQSPLCVEVDRMVRSGVVVVVAAGNTGYGTQTTDARGAVPAGLPLSINDPGNSELAITVGATHREMPHLYGVSYFSSKGPTGDGRPKPDLVAPGEKIISCATGAQKADAAETAARNASYDYMEESGTSMAAPHVSGVAAAFLSVRREFIGRPDAVKEIFLSTATDLKRDRYFQGHGLVDAMRAIQSV